MSTLGENVRKKRIQLKMSQQQLADALGYRTRSSITKIEKDLSALSQDKLVALANVLNTSVEYLLTGENDPDAHGTIISQDMFSDNDNSSDRKRKCVAVILAGGRNRINRYSIPYQFITIKDKPLIVYTMEAYESHPLVDEIDVVCLDGWEDMIPAYCAKYGITKFNKVIPAGYYGIGSVKNAVEGLISSHNYRDIIIIQEATRPLTDQETISNSIRCCKQYGNAIIFEKLDNATPFLYDPATNNLQHLDALKLINVQSPEVYTFGYLLTAFNDARKLNHELTETICAVFLHNIGKELKFFESGRNNLRVVSEEDLILLEALLNHRQNI